ncbi:MAG: hypothetical protein ACRDXC_01950 [Acidimicrobiales bacterium]
MRPPFGAVTARRRPTGMVAGLLFLVGALTVLVFLTVLAAVGLLVMALVGVLIGAERLLGLLVPAYGRRRRARYLTMPAGLVRVVRLGRFGPFGPFGSGRSQVIDARSSELRR